MLTKNCLHTTQKTYFFLLFSLLSNYLNAQNQSFGGGMGINSLYSNGVNLQEYSHSRYGSPQDKPQAFSKPQVSLNVDYNFPTELSKKWGLLQRIYNPLFSKAHLQLKGQAMFNQFRIDVNNSNSILTFGSSLLYFPVALNSNRDFNFFFETGYKAALNNATFEPFHCAVVGFGARHNLGNDWILQTNFNYTVVFNDYIDQYGKKGFTYNNREGYALFNVSILKSIFNRTEKRGLDRAKDSLAMAHTLAAQVAEKGQKVTEKVKSLENALKPLLEKTQKDKLLSFTIFEKGYEIGEKAISIRINLKKGKQLNIAESSIDSLKTLISTLNISRLVDYDWANDGHVFEQDIAKKIQESQNDIQEMKQNLNLADAYLPSLKDFEQAVQHFKVKQAGDARLTVIDIEQAIVTTQKEYNEAHNNVKEIQSSFDKGEKNIKNALEEIEKTEKKIAELRKEANPPKTIVPKKRSKN